MQEGPGDEATVNDKMDSAEDAYNSVRQALLTAFAATNTSSASNPFALEYFGMSGVVVRMTQPFSIAFLIAPARMCELSSAHSHYAFPKMDEESREPVKNPYLRQQGLNCFLQ